MATYTYDVTGATARDHVRRLLRDTVIDPTASAVWSNEEITAQLNISDNLYSAAATLLESESLDAARIAKRVTVGFWGKDEQQVSSKMLEIADRYHKTADRYAASSVEVSTLHYDIDQWGRDDSEYTDNDET